MMKVVTSCYMVYHVLFYIILFYFNVNGQPLYENPQEDPLGASDAHSFYWKIYGKSDNINFITTNVVVPAHIKCFEMHSSRESFGIYQWQSLVCILADRLSL